MLYCTTVRGPGPVKLYLVAKDTTNIFAIYCTDLYFV